MNFLRSLKSLVMKPKVYRLSLTDKSNELEYFYVNSLFKSVPKDAKALAIDISSVGVSYSMANLISNEIVNFKKNRPQTPVLTFAEDIICGSAIQVLVAGTESYANTNTLFGFYKPIHNHWNISPFLEKNEVKMQFIEKGKYKIYVSPLKELDEERRNYLLKLKMDNFEAFAENVAVTSGKVSKDKLEKVLVNDFVSAEQMIEAKVVDKIGNLESVIFEKFPKTAIKLVKLKWRHMIRAQKTTAVQLPSIEDRMRSSAIGFSVNNLIKCNQIYI